MPKCFFLKINFFEKKYGNNILQEKTELRALWSQPLFSVFFPIYFEQTENGHL